jgi:hypothetical protein
MVWMGNGHRTARLCIVGVGSAQSGYPDHVQHVRVHLLIAFAGMINMQQYNRALMKGLRLGTMDFRSGTCSKECLPGQRAWP